MIQSHPQQQITFTDFMDCALYDPDYGYYNQRALNLGPRGDFLTSPHVSPDFAELLAIQFVEMWHQLDRPDPFTIVEMGAGSGVLAQDLLKYLYHHHPDLWSTLTYCIIERSTALQAVQKRRLIEYDKVHWLTRLDDRSKHNYAIVGCLFSNELVDAFPVHRVTVQDGSLFEIYVTFDGCHFVEQVADLSTPQLKDYFQLVGIDITAATYPTGYTTEVNLAALEWIQAVAHGLERGYVLTIDYGYQAPSYYHPVRSQGTLLCYHNHLSGSNPYQYLGLQDMTAHVDFTALQQRGLQVGLSPLGLTRQESFLSSLGLIERLAHLSQLEGSVPISRILQQRQALQTLIDPLGLGKLTVLLQTKGLQDPIQLQGFKLPVPSSVF